MDAEDEDNSNDCYSGDHDFINEDGCTKASGTDHSRTIIHFDADCFYAQVEMLRNPELRSKPLGIQQKNIMVTCNYVARKYGLTKLMYITDAKKKCSDLVLVSGEDLTHYRKMSYEISEFFQKYSPKVERLGFDENFVDVTEMVETRIKNSQFESSFSGHLYGSDRANKDELDTPCSCGCLMKHQIASHIAASMRRTLNMELGITCCAGIAHNKLLAKLAGSVYKPNQQTSILPHCVLQLITSLPNARSIPGIGSSSSKRLQSIGISSIWDLQQASLQVLKREFPENVAQTLKELSFGQDSSQVVPFSLPLTLSDEDSFKCCNNIDDALVRTKSLMSSLLHRLFEDGRSPQTLRLTIRRIAAHKESRQCPLPASTFRNYNSEGDENTLLEYLMPVAMMLFKKMVNTSNPFHLTLINVCFANLSKPSQNQSSITSFFSQTRQPRAPQTPSQSFEVENRMLSPIGESSYSSYSSGQQNALCKSALLHSQGTVVETKCIVEDVTRDVTCHMDAPSHSASSVSSSSSPPLLSSSQDQKFEKTSHLTASKKSLDLMLSASASAVEVDIPKESEKIQGDCETFLSRFPHIHTGHEKPLFSPKRRKSERDKAELKDAEESSLSKHQKTLERTEVEEVAPKIHTKGTSIPIEKSIIKNSVHLVEDSFTQGNEPCFASEDFCWKEVNLVPNVQGHGKDLGNTSLGSDSSIAKVNMIDPEVFSSLPNNIQAEIKAHISMGSEHLFFDKPESSQSIQQRNVKQTHPTKNKFKVKGQTTLSSFFKKS